MQWVLGGFLIVHGLIHTAWIVPAPNAPDYPFSLAKSTAFPSTAPEFLRPLGIAVASAVTLLFVLAGLGVMGVGGLEEYWRLSAVVGSLFSMLLIGVFWHPWFVVGALIDIGIVIAVLLGWG